MIQKEVYTCERRRKKKILLYRLEQFEHVKIELRALITK